MEVSSFPAVKAFIGKIDKVSVKADNFKYNDIPFAEADFLLEDVRFNVISLFSEEFDFSLENQGKASFEMTEDNLADYLSEKFPDFKKPEINVYADKMMMKGISTAAGVGIDFEISGALKIEEGKPVFKPEEINIGKSGLGSLLVERTQAEMKFDFDLESSKIPLKVTGISLQEGRIIIEGISQKTNFENGV